MKQQLPIGISDFKKVIDENRAYIDKTLLIEEIVETGIQVALIPRPRRFGKTLNLSMLRYFFEKSEKDTSYLFTGLNIWKNVRCRNLQGQFPVIFLTFKVSV
ncbi:MAG: AAA family ATPase [Verrucomicrobia bacterium]|nr:AAA family ATPase [Verrucomicrobiota bacterium]